MNYDYELWTEPKDKIEYIDKSNTYIKRFNKTAKRLNKISYVKILDNFKKIEYKIVGVKLS